MSLFPFLYSVNGKPLRSSEYLVFNVKFKDSGERD